MEAAEPWVIPPGGIVPVWFQKLTGRYVDPRLEEEHHHDAISMETTSQDHALHALSKNEQEKE